MRLVVTYSSKEGLHREYLRRGHKEEESEEVPQDFFAEGDSPETIEAVLEAFRASGYEVHGLEADEQVCRNLMDIGPDLVFNIAEGLYGDSRESYVPTLCEHLGLGYSGSDPLTLALCLNKARAKEILSYHGIANAPFMVVYNPKDARLQAFTYPAIVKPLSEGSSKGIYDNAVVRNETESQQCIGQMLSRYNQAVILESFLEGQEFTVALWGNGDEVEVLPIVALNFADLPAGANRIYSYEAKWLWDVPSKPLDIFVCPAEIEKTLQEQIEQLVIKTYHVLNIRDWARIDVRLDMSGRPHILEINPLPGILPKIEDNSCFPKAARTAGYGYAEMLDHVVRIALKRIGREKAVRKSA